MRESERVPHYNNIANFNLSLLLKEDQEASHTKPKESRPFSNIQELLAEDGITLPQELTEKLGFGEYSWQVAGPFGTRSVPRLFVAEENAREGTLPIHKAIATIDVARRVPVGEQPHPFRVRLAGIDRDTNRILGATYDSWPKHPDIFVLTRVNYGVTQKERDAINGRINRAAELATIQLPTQDDPILTNAAGLITKTMQDKTKNSTTREKQTHALNLYSALTDYPSLQYGLYRLHMKGNNAYYLEEVGLATDVGDEDLTIVSSPAEELENVADFTVTLPIHLE